MNDNRRVIVIGSGPSGAMAALALLQHDIPVTMLESGQNLPPGLLVRAMGRNVFRRKPNLEPRKDHVSSDDPDAQWYHELAPGGLSNHWTGAVPRFAPEDFFEGARLHECYRWPVTYDDLAPYYARSEQFLGVVAALRDVPGLPAPHIAYERQLPKGWQPVAREARARGRGLTPIPLADGSPWLINTTGTAFNSFTRIVPLLRRYPHFQLLLGAHALRLEWCGPRKKVSAVIYVDRATGCEQRIDAAAVMVAAGPLASTKILLDSSCNDFPQGLGNTEGVLGRYLHDHAHHWCVIETDAALPRLGHAAYLTRVPYQESAPLLAAGCTLGSGRGTHLEKALSFTPLKTKQFGVVTFGTMVPTFDNYVRLDPVSRDEFGLPLLDIHIHFDDEVLRNMMEARTRLLAILESAGYRAAIRESVTRLTPGSSVHYGGTVRMHASPRHGMLNAWNRLHAVDNVVVADASSFTTGVEKNPTLTAMALAARAAHRLAVDLKAS